MRYLLSLMLAACAGCAAAPTALPDESPIKVETFPIRYEHLTDCAKRTMERQLAVVLEHWDDPEHGVARISLSSLRPRSLFSTEPATVFAVTFRASASSTTVELRSDRQYDIFSPRAWQAVEACAKASPTAPQSAISEEHRLPS